MKASLNKIKQINRQSRLTDGHSLQQGLSKINKYMKTSANKIDHIFYDAYVTQQDNMYSST